MDDLLQRKSFIDNISKNDLIRKYIVEGMRAEADRAKNNNQTNIVAKQK